MLQMLKKYVDVIKFYIGHVALLILCSPKSNADVKPAEF